MRETKADNERREQAEKIAVSLRRRVPASSLLCSACGAEARRKFAKYCLVCGKNLWEDYEPLDALRASYRLQGKNFQFEQMPDTKIENLFKKNENKASELAWAFLVYSMMPYLGILFFPGAFLMGGIGIIAAHRKPDLGGRGTAIYSVVLSLIILAVQILLWWLLYIVPELGRNF